MASEELLPHLDRIALKLKEGRAIAVVGAGFSKNAMPRSGLFADRLKDGDENREASNASHRINSSKLEMPDWSQLVAQMAREIHPTDENAQKQILKRGMLHVAQAYEVTFKRPQLDSLIKKAINDDAFEPGDQHHQLLALPWSDIITFNYDTLLEKAEAKKPEPRFSTIYQKSELIVSSKPRIIKLHGSLPSGPFIITDEDFRTFPQKQPAFVNTVRQMMIENVLVLFGFSGDDPNFRQMHGWVRDLFENDSNHVYLCHFGEFGVVESDLLRKTYSITTINLAHLNGGVVADYATALTQLFSHLSEAVRVRALHKPIAEQDWPSTNVIFYSPLFAQSNYSGREFPIKDLYDEWTNQRRAYPGWIIAPLEARQTIGDSTEHWPPFLKKGASIEHLAKVVQLLYEIVWRWRLSLVAIPLDWADWIEETCTAAFQQRPAVQDIDKRIAFLLLACLQKHREDFDENRFRNVLAKCEQLRRGNPDLDAELLHEECLYAFQELDFNRLESLSERWSSMTSHQIVNHFRRLGWLAQLGKNKEACESADSLLNATKPNGREGTENIKLLSAEGWALYFHRIIHSIPDDTVEHSASDHLPRLKELKPFECDPWERIKELTSRLQQPTRAPSATGEMPNFDPGTITRTLCMTASSHEGRSHAFQYIRLFDYLGIPHHPGRLDVAGKEMANAAREIMPWAFKWSCALRIRNADKTLLDETLSREFVLRLREDDAKWLTNLSLRILKQANILLPLDGPGVYEHHAGKNLRYHMGLASMMTLRMSSEELGLLFDVTCKLRQHAGFEAAFMIWDGWADLLRRTLFAASREQLARWLPILASMPLPPPTPHDDNVLPLGIEPFAAAEHADVLHFGISLGLEPARLDTWIDAFKSSSPVLRCAAFKRLWAYFNSCQWTGAKVASFESALWTIVDSQGLPTRTGYYETTYLGIPGATSTKTRELLRMFFTQRAVPSLYRQNSEDSSITITADLPKHYIESLRIATESPLLKHVQQPNPPSLIQWSNEEACILLNKLVQWWNEQKGFLAQNVANHSLFWEPGEVVESFQKCIAYALLPCLDLSDQSNGLVLSAIRGVSSEMQSMGLDSTLIAVFEMVASPTPSMNDSLPTIDRGLVSNNLGEVEAAVDALSYWLAWSFWKNRSLEPAKRSFEIMADRVRLRVPTGLTQVMRGCRWILHDFKELITPVHVEALNDGLRELFNETRIDPAANHEHYSEDNAAIQGLCDLRRYSAHLAVELHRLCIARPEFKAPDAVKWVESLPTDRLPEVRRVLWRVRPD